ncbi:MAG TPA: DUF7682 family zinc-binding protein [Elainellaceae cyanobacterium]
MSRCRRYRKRFACGHRGFGQYCHCCADRQRQQTQKQSQRQAQRTARALQRQQWQATFAHDSIDLRKLPPKMVLKVRSLLTAIDQGATYWQLSGKRLIGRRNLIRIPVSYRYRLLCWDNGESLQPLQVMSHEAYNAIARHSHRYLSALSYSKQA